VRETGNTGNTLVTEFVSNSAGVTNVASVTAKKIGDIKRILISRGSNANLTHFDIREFLYALLFSSGNTGNTGNTGGIARGFCYQFEIRTGNNWLHIVGGLTQ
jgi:hypothetical protein